MKDTSQTSLGDYFIMFSVRVIKSLPYLVDEPLISIKIKGYKLVENFNDDFNIILRCLI